MDSLAPVRIESAKDLDATFLPPGLEEFVQMQREQERSPSSVGSTVFPSEEDHHDVASQASNDVSILESPRGTLKDLLTNFRAPPGLEDVLSEEEVRDFLGSMSDSPEPPPKQTDKQSFLKDLAASLLTQEEESTNGMLARAKVANLPVVANPQPKVIHLSGFLQEEKKVASDAQPNFPALPSRGSAYHFAGLCKPCVFFHSDKGCENGTDCLHCHLCTAGEKKRRRKQAKQASTFISNSTQLLGMY
jgi:hypothetical protein